VVNKNTANTATTESPKPKPQTKLAKPKTVAKKEAAKQPAKPKVVQKKEPKEEPELKRISYTDFQKKHNKQENKVAKAAPEKIVTPKLNVDDITSELENLVLAGPSSPSHAPSQLPSYTGHIRQRVDSVWQAPGGISGSHSQATVSYRVNPAGNLSHIHLLTSSGNKEFDNSILSAFERLSKVSPPPEREAYTFQLTFRLNQA